MASPSCTTSMSRGKGGLDGGACCEGARPSETESSEGSMVVFLSPSEDRPRVGLLVVSRGGVDNNFQLKILGGEYLGSHLHPLGSCCQILLVKLT